MNLNELANAPEDQRDRAWENRFLKAFTESNVSVLSADPQAGPDGWPYLLVEATAQSDEPAQKVLAWLEDKGIGLVVNPRKEYPDYILTYGMIWHFRETGFFFVDNDPNQEGKVEFSTSDIKGMGEPSLKYLPQHVRKVIRDFLRDQMVMIPKILAIEFKDGRHDLAFSLESLGNPPVSEHAGIAEAIGWFLPSHYSVLLVSEKGLSPFSPL